MSIRLAALRNSVGIGIVTDVDGQHLNTFIMLKGLLSRQARKVSSTRRWGSDLGQTSIICLTSFTTVHWMRFGGGETFTKTFVFDVHICVFCRYCNPSPRRGDALVLGTAEVKEVCNCLNIVLNSHCEKFPVRKLLSLVRLPPDEGYKNRNIIASHQLRICRPLHRSR